jgi:uncharacterized repeat protein (TIGR03803 family)
MKKRLLFTLAAFVIAGNIFAQHTYITGLTNAGGDVGYGTTYSFDATTGKDSLLFNFGGETNSILLGSPEGNIVQAPNGLLYGMANVGGNYNLGGLFSYDPKTGKDSALVSFDTLIGGFPIGSLILASNGLLYGTVPFGGLNFGGVLFCYNPTTGKDSIVFNFNYATGGQPGKSLMQASNGLLYGLNGSGGTYLQGTLYSFNTVTGQDSLLFSFNDSSGTEPYSSLIQASNGLLYGMTLSGGRYGNGTMFCFNTVTGQDSVLLHFHGNIGASPAGSLMQASNGLLYGMTELGGTWGQGLVFAYNPLTGSDSIVLEFNGSNGGSPTGTLMQASNGLLYGMTQFGGTNGEGVIFSYDPITGKDSIIINLSGALNGDAPLGDLFEASDGFLYGMTSAGGSSGTGTLFRLNMVTQQDSLLLNFGVSPQSTQNSPMLASDGMVYGMTYRGGIYDKGILFRYNPNTGQDTILLNFHDSIGVSPNGSLIQAKNGLLYGFTVSSDLGGTLFSYDPVKFKDSVLVDFNGYDGQNPFGSLIQASDGLLYGTISGGGTHDFGVIMSYNTITGKDSILYNFNDTLGWSPYGTLTEGANKTLYGTAEYGGATGYGVLFSYDIVHAKFDTLASMSPLTTIAPQGNLIVDTNQHIIYGVSTSSTFVNIRGALFSYNLNTNKFDTLFTFNGPNGVTPTGLLMWDTAANDIYGTTYGGGSNNYGVLFRYNTVTGLDTTLYSFQDSLALSHRPERFKSAHSFASHSIGVSPSGIMLTHKNPTGINNLNPKKESIAVYPNPASGTTNVVFSTSGKHYLEVDDITGRALRNVECTGQHYLLNCSGIAPGVYFIKSRDDGQNALAVAKVIVE